MNATTMQNDLDAPTTESLAPETTGAVSGAPRTLLRLEGAAAVASAAFAFSALGGRWSLFALLFLVPDLSMLGYLAGRRVGAVSYNAAHSYLGPALLAATGAVTGAATGGALAALWVACIWAAHVGFDRMLGYGLKYGTHFGDTHLGGVGRARR
ncbi:MAG TPA: DUF4260 domain-containing protein [Polyangiaceae bacterium]|jgi:hypothetical protein